MGEEGRGVVGGHRSWKSVSSKYLTPVGTTGYFLPLETSRVFTFRGKQEIEIGGIQTLIDQ